MPTRPTFDDFYDAFKTETQARQPDLTDWEDGSALDAVGGAGAMLADEVMAGTVDEFRAHFIDTADGAELDTLVQDRFGLTREAATYAVGLVRVTRDASTAGTTVSIPAGWQASATTDDGTIIVETDAAAEIPAGESFTEVAATATTAGLAGNLAVGVLTTIPSPLVDDPLATVTNPSRFTGGSPAETDAQLRDRVRRYFTTLRRGTPAALKAGALTVPGVLFATVDESDAHPADGGVVRVYIGDPDARASSVLVSKVANELEDWRAAGIRLEVLAASREEVDLVVAVYIRRGADQTEVRAAVISALDDLIGNLPVGDTLVLEQVASAAIRAHRDVRYARVTTPTSDIVPSAAGNAIRVPSTRREVGFYEVA